jgi:hypothetical protein
MTDLPLSDGHRGREVTWRRECALFFYTPHCVRYYDMVFQDIWRFARVVMMTGSAILDWYNAVA